MLSSSLDTFKVKAVQDDISSKTIRLWLRNAVDYNIGVGYNVVLHSSQFLALGWSIVDQWLINGWSMVDQWLTNGWSMVDQCNAKSIHCIYDSLIYRYVTLTKIIKVFYTYKTTKYPLHFKWNKYLNICETFENNNQFFEKKK